MRFRIRWSPTYVDYRWRYESPYRLIPQNASVLEVGCGQNGIASLRSDLGVTACDVELHTAIGVPFVQASATMLPFADKSFDFAISIDMMEHIGPRYREKVMSELNRVAWNTLISFPSGAAAAAADRKALKYYGEAHRWLQEHIAFGLPNVLKSERRRPWIPCWLLTHYFQSRRPLFRYLFGPLGFLVYQVGRISTKNGYRVTLVTSNGCT